MANHSLLRALLLLSVVLLGRGAQAQIGESDPSNLSSPSPGLEAAWSWNQEVLRSACVWERKIRYLPSAPHQEEILADERAYLKKKGLSEEEIKTRLKTLRETLRKDTRGSKHLSEVRLQWDGVRTRRETWEPERERPLVQ